MTLVRVMTVRDWKRRQNAMSSEEIGRKRRKPKRRHRVEGARRRPRRHRVGAERRPRPRKGPWSQAIKLGDNIEIRAKAPYRAASLEVKPGLFVVGELRSDALEFGAGALDVTKSLLKAASKGVDEISKAKKGKGSEKRSSKSGSSAYKRKLAALQQRELSLQIREAKVQRAEDRLRQCYAAAMGSGDGTPLKRDAVRWMGDEDWAEDLAGDDSTPKLEEPNTLEYLMWKFNQYEE